MAGPATPVIGSATNATRGGSATGRSSGSGSRSSQSSPGGASRSSAAGGETARRVQRVRTCRTCPRWLYETGAKYIDTTLGVSYYHLFVRATEQRLGLQPVFRAGPSQDGSPSVLGVVSGFTAPDSSKDQEEDHVPETGDYGTIEAVSLPEYVASIEFDLHNRFAKVRETNANYTSRFLTCIVLVNQKAIKYEPTGPNSNSFAMTCLAYAKLPVRKPNVRAPGHGMRLL